MPASPSMNTVFLACKEVARGARRRGGATRAEGCRSQEKELAGHTDTRATARCYCTLWRD